MSTTLTYREVKHAIDVYADHVANNTCIGDTSKARSTVAEALSIGDRTVRDYLMGLPIVIGVKDADFMVTMISYNMPEGTKRHAYSVLSAYAYEQGFTYTAKDYLKTCLEEEAGYSLAVLLNRVYDAGWKVESFQSMRNALHSKVSESMLSDDTLSNY